MAYQRALSMLKSLMKPLVAIALVVAIVFGHADGALAASSGGRIGGGSFRAPSRSYSAPSRSYRAPSTRVYSVPYSGGGINPFFFMPMPFVTVGGGFGGLFTILMVMAVAGFLVQTLRRVTSDSESGEGILGGSSQATVAQLQIGLLAGARTLKADLDRIAMTANTNSSAGLTKVLQETTLALLRHPEYWAYAYTESQTIGLVAAETQFNRLALAERSRFTQETLSNVGGQQSSWSASTPVLTGVANRAFPEDATHAAGDYIVVTILVGVQGKFSLPKVTNAEELRQAVNQLGAIAADQLMALEVLWTPQAANDTLSADDLLTEYPHLRLI
ncbi:MAG: DUF1517 domain-containing protein [Cyanobacteria bacterium]|nr:DUF1517 domain-containing protein [Cyanobacteriota bacterium]MDW8200136.1 DUF1517 domain-containing protein [Cyanobacteriota bacterium SKYGB_h_bin112]